MDLQVEKAFDFQQYGRLSVSANFFNVTNTNTVIRRTRHTSSFNRIEENIFPRCPAGVRYSLNIVAAGVLRRSCGS
jgi:hypothetical protein